MKLIKQFDGNDCGAACIAMICRYYKSYNSITQIRKIAGTDRNGTSLRGILQACKNLSLDAKAVKGNSEVLNGEFPVPFIAHVVYEAGWNHFVVVYKISEKKVYVADPAGSKIKYRREDFLKIWSGYSVLVSPTPDFKINKGQNKLLKFLPLIKPHIRFVILMFVASLLLSLIGICSGLYFQFFIDDVVGAKAITTLHSLSLIAVFLSFFTSVLTIIRSQFLRLFSLKTDISLSMSYIKHILRLPVDFFDSRQTGEIISRFDDSEKIRLAFSNIAFGTILDFVIMFFIGIYLAISNLSLFLILISIFVLSSIIIYCFSKFFIKNYREQLRHKASINSFLIEMFSGLHVIKSLNAHEYSAQKYEENLVQYVDLQQEAWNKGNIKELFTNFLSGLSVNLIFWIGGYLILKDKLSLGQLISFNTLSAFFTGPLNRFIDFQPQIQEAVVSAERIGEIFELEKEKLNSDQQISVDNQDISVPIEFNNVTFRYGVRHPVFENLSFTTDNNHKIAFVGASGCGKSTIMKLLLKFYSIENGSITISGQNLNDISADYLRSSIGYVPQEVYLFSGTIYENITMGRSEYSLEDVKNACEKAQASTFIENLPDKYFSKISERGSSLSGGERQRIALARALLSCPKILLLDEATSALDTVSEREFQKVVDELGDNKIITITVAHRLSTIVNSDLIFVMNNGQIEEKGTHEELLRLKGLYYKLWNM